MAKFHCAIDWACLECAKHSASSDQDDSVLSFPSSALLKEHLLISHPTLDPVELDLLVETGKRTLEIQRVRCPLCRVGLVTLEDGDEDEEGINSTASLPSIGQAIGMIRLEEDEHIATHIHEFALQSLPYRREATSEGSQVSFSQSRPNITYEDLKNLKASNSMETPSTDPPPMYNLGDMRYMLDDLQDKILEIIYKREPVDQSPVNMRTVSHQEIAKFNHNQTLSRERWDDVADGIEELQRRLEILRCEDIDTFAISLNECRVTVSQLNDLAVDDVIKESLCSQLLNNLNHSNAILQQAFASTLDASTGRDGHNSSLIETEEYRAEVKEFGLKEVASKESELRIARLKKLETEEAESDSLCEQEVRSEETPSEERETAPSGIEAGIKEDQTEGARSGELAAKRVEEQTAREAKEQAVLEAKQLAKDEEGFKTSKRRLSPNLEERLSELQAKGAIRAEEKPAREAKEQAALEAERLAKEADEAAAIAKEEDEITPLLEKRASFRGIFTKGRQTVITPTMLRRFATMDPNKSRGLVVSYTSPDPVVSTTPGPSDNTAIISQVSSPQPTNNLEKAVHRVITSTTTIRKLTPEENEVKVSDLGKFEAKEQRSKNAERREIEPEPASDKAVVPAAETPAKLPAVGLPIVESSITKQYGKKQDDEDDIKDLNAEDSEHARIPTVGKGKGLAVTDTPILNEPRYKSPQDIQEDMAD